MASIQEKLADSLIVLKEYQEKNKNSIIKGVKVLGETHTRRLIKNGYLERIIKGWYMPSMPGLESDTTTWYASYWAFIAAYCNSRFGEEWSLTPEESLDFYAGETIAPSQIIIRSPKASNNVFNLMHGDSFLDISASLPTKLIKENQYGLNVYSLAEALLFCSPTYFVKNSVNARTCLCMLNDADEILRFVADKGNSSRASRIVGALRNIGKVEMADKIQVFMTKLGHELHVEDPFIDKFSENLADSRIVSPYAVRLRLMWKQMKNRIEEMHFDKIDNNLSVDNVLENMEVNYVRDSYHSLSIEGYHVTEGLIERVRSGQWNPKDDQADAERKNALAARGYYQAFLKVKDSVKEIMQGADAGKVVGRDFENWHFEMFQPCITAGMVKPSDLIGYRTTQVYIRGSKHTPLSPEAVRDAMPVFIDLLEKENSPLVRAVLGHFFFVFIHPYMDGNGRTARFIMNVMLVTAGYTWKVITVDRRIEYMKALEAASTMGDIAPFAKIILG